MLSQRWMSSDPSLELPPLLPRFCERRLSGEALAAHPAFVAKVLFILPHKSVIRSCWLLQSKVCTSLETGNKFLEDNSLSHCASGVHFNVFICVSLVLLPLVLFPQPCWVLSLRHTLTLVLMPSYGASTTCLCLQCLAAFVGFIVLLITSISARVYTIRVLNHGWYIDALLQGQNMGRVLPYHGIANKWRWK